MDHLNLLPAFCIIIMINVILLSFTVAQEIRYRNVKMKSRFYPTLILWFICCAFIFRGVHLVYLMAVYPKHPFNRFDVHTYDDMTRVYLSYLSGLFYGMASLTMFLKWIDDYYGIPINSNFDFSKAARSQIIVKITQIVTCILTLACLLICVELQIERVTYRPWIASLFILSGIGLQVTAYMFLKQLKKYRRVDYDDNHINIKIITIVCSIVMIVKGISIVLSIVSFYWVRNKEFDRKHFHTLFDVVELSVYFLESIPSVIVFVVRWKTLQQYQNIFHKGLMGRFGDRRQFLDNESSATDPEYYKLGNYTRTVKETTEASEYLDRTSMSRVGSY